MKEIKAKVGESLLPIVVRMTCRVDAQSLPAAFMSSSILPSRPHFAVGTIAYILQMRKWKLRGGSVTHPKSQNQFHNGARHVSWPNAFPLPVAAQLLSLLCHEQCLRRESPGPFSPSNLLLEALVQSSALAAPLGFLLVSLFPRPPAPPHLGCDAVRRVFLFPPIL